VKTKDQPYIPKDIVEELRKKARWCDDPWFLRPDHLPRLAEQFPGGEKGIRESADELKKLFPNEYCLKVISCPRSPTVLLGIFSEGFYYHLFPALLLGADLSLADGWEKDASLVIAFQNEPASHARRVEVGIWAGMKRAGLEVERISETGERPTPDFLVKKGIHRAYVEVKCLESSELDSSCSDLNHSLSSPLLLSKKRDVIDGLEVELFLDESYVQDLKSKNTETRDAVRKEVKDRLDDARDIILDAAIDGFREGELPIEGIGTAKFKNPTKGSWSINFANLPSTDQRKQLDRAFRKIRKAAKQSDRSTPFVVVIYSSRFDLPVENAVNLLEKIGKETTLAVDAVVFLNQFRSNKSFKEILNHQITIFNRKKELLLLPTILKGTRSWQKEL
jgi:hypothetical protein